MIRVSTGPDGQSIHNVVVVVFDRASGRVRGTYIHGSHGAHDEAGARRGGERLVAELEAKLGSGYNLDIVLLRAEALKGGPIERVDPDTRQIVQGHVHRARRP
jgi:hypothetical protein